MQTFGVSKSIKLLTIVVIALSLAIIIAIAVGLSMPPKTPPTGNMDGTHNDQPSSAATQIKTPAWLENAENLGFLVEDNTLQCTI